MFFSTVSSSKRGDTSKRHSVTRTVTRFRFLAISLPLSAVVMAAAQNGLHSEEIYYHSNTYNASTTTYPGPAFPVAVKFDVSGSSATYQLTSFGVLYSGAGNPFPANTKIAICVWDSNGVPIFTSNAFDLSGQDGSLAMRWFDVTSNHVQVSNTFYAGYQDLTSATLPPFPWLGYMVDSPSGNNYGRSYRYQVSNGTWTSASDDFWFNVQVRLFGDANSDGTVNVPTSPQSFQITIGPVKTGVTATSTVMAPSTGRISLPCFRTTIRVRTRQALVQPFPSRVARALRRGFG